MGGPRGKEISHCVVQRSSNALGWEVVETFDDYEQALERLDSFFGKLILYK